MSNPANDKYKVFKSLHERHGIFVILNAWDAGSAKLLASLGFEAIATTSAGLALSIGQRDSSNELTSKQVLENAALIGKATDLPVSADLENGFSEIPERCAQIVKSACALGLVGGSIEDSRGDLRNPLISFNQAVERIAAVCEAVSELPFLITARADNYLHEKPDLDDTIKRLQAFSSAGADVLYAPGLIKPEEVQVLCQSVDRPVNVVMGLRGSTATVEELQFLGVKRISVGGSFARAAFAEFVRAAKEVKELGTFNYANRAISGSGNVR